MAGQPASSAALMMGKGKWARLGHLMGVLERSAVTGGDGEEEGHPVPGGRQALPSFNGTGASSVSRCGAVALR